MALTSQGSVEGWSISSGQGRSCLPPLDPRGLLRHSESLDVCWTPPGWNSKWMYTNFTSVVCIVLLNNVMLKKNTVNKTSIGKIRSSLVLCVSSCTLSAMKCYVHCMKLRVVWYKSYFYSRMTDGSKYFSHLCVLQYIIQRGEMKALMYILANSLLLFTHMLRIRTGWREWWPTSVSLNVWTNVKMGVSLNWYKYDGTIIWTFFATAYPDWVGYPSTADSSQVFSHSVSVTRCQCRSVLISSDV